LKTDEGEGNDPQRNLKESYIRQNRGKEEINLMARPNKRKSKDNKKRRRWHFKLSAKREDGRKVMPYP